MAFGPLCAASTQEDSDTSSVSQTNTDTQKIRRYPWKMGRPDSLVEKALFSVKEHKGKTALSSVALAGLIAELLRGEKSLIRSGIKKGLKQGKGLLDTLFTKEDSYARRFNRWVHDHKGLSLAALLGLLTATSAASAAATRDKYVDRETRGVVPDFDDVSLGEYAKAVAAKSAYLAGAPVNYSYDKVRSLFGSQSSDS